TLVSSSLAVPGSEDSVTGRDSVTERDSITEPVPVVGRRRAVDRFAQFDWAAWLGRSGQGFVGWWRGKDLAGRAFALVTVLPALLLTAWLVPGIGLLLAGRFLPVPMLLISVP